MPRNFGVSHHRHDFSTVPSPVPTLVVLGLTLAILVSLGVSCGVF